MFKDEFIYRFHLTYVLFIHSFIHVTLHKFGVKLFIFLCLGN